MSDTMASPTSEPSQYHQPQQSQPPQQPLQPQQPPQPQHQGLPSITSLTNGLPPSSQQRSPEQESLKDSWRPDSGRWSQQNGQSKHNSANSGLHVSTLLNPDDSPSRNSVPSTPLSGRIPTSAQSGTSQLPSINQGFTEPGNRTSHADSYASVDSRRSSVDSRMHSGFGNLYINNPASPQESASTSQVSLAASLRRPNGGPMSPLGGRSSVRSHAPRIAPPIMPVGRAPGAPDPTAAGPTKGFAWAFPDTGTVPEERRGSESGDSSIGHGISRTNSLAASSVRSSLFSADSAMPPGQRRFDDVGHTTHHHSLQNRTISGLQSESNQASTQSVGNYSRTPELRVSHKLAERKRRSEMKDLFEELNKAVPANGGSKASKWEVLTKAIDYIRNCQQAEQRLQVDLGRLQREAEYARDASQENEQLKREIEMMQSRLHQLEPNQPHIYGQYSSRISDPKQQRPPQTNGSAINLPPLHPPGSSGGHAHGNGYAPGGPPPAAMQGVEYAYHGR